MSTVLDILDRAMELPVEDRKMLLAELEASLHEEEPEDQGQVAEAWADELAKRRDEIVSGKVKGIPLDRACDEIIATLRRTGARK